MTDKGFHHSPGRPTEIAAAVAIGPKLKTLRDAIFKCVEDAGAYGVIPDEAWKQILSWRPGTPETSIRPRFIELHQNGRIKRNGNVRKNRRNSNEEVWIVGTDPTAKKKTRQRTILCVGS